MCDTTGSRVLSVAPRKDLEQVVKNAPVVFLSDAAHAMPIFASEGGNHGFMDGVQLGDLLAKYYKGEEEGGMSVAILKFYEGALDRRYGFPLIF